MSDALKTQSRRLSMLLRHAPEKAGLTLGSGGWVAVEDLLTGSERMQAPLTREDLETIVANNDKKRFTFSDDGTRIRAAQGHSVTVDMDYTPVTPPNTLFHGTATRTLPLIREGGLKAMSRQHVHLSADHETAVRVGKRHGSPVVLTVRSGTMHADGHDFYQAENGVWLTDAVPARYLEGLDNDD